MKKVLFVSKLICLSLFIITSCSTGGDDNNNGTGGSGGSGGGGGNNTTVQIQEIKNAVSSGMWVVTFYFDTDHEETNNFSTYGFSFNTTGSMSATNGVDTYNGTWSVTNSSSNNGDIHFNIMFSSHPDFIEISDDWKVLEYSNTKVELTDVSGGNGGVDFLTFERL